MTSCQVVYLQKKTSVKLNCITPLSSLRQPNTLLFSKTVVKPNSCSVTLQVYDLYFLRFRLTCCHVLIKNFVKWSFSRTVWDGFVLCSVSRFKHPFFFAYFQIILAFNKGIWIVATTILPCKSNLLCWSINLYLVQLQSIYFVVKNRVNLLT